MGRRGREPKPNPCRGCELRAMGCHGRCSAYIIWSIERAAERATERKERDMKRDLKEFVQRGRMGMRRK